MSKYRELLRQREDIEALEHELTAAVAPTSSGVVTLSARSVSEAKTSLAQVRESQQKLRRLQESAAVLLVEMLTGSLAPHVFWLPLLFHHVAPLLERALPRATPLLSCADTCKLMACLEEVVLSAHFELYLEMSHLSKEQLQVIRLVLSRNLARASIFEASMPVSAVPANSAFLNVPTDHDDPSSPSAGGGRGDVYPLAVSLKQSYAGTPWPDKRSDTFSRPSPYAMVNAYQQHPLS